MARSNTGTILLLWLMLLVGGGALFACVYLPVWLEVRGLRQAHADARRRIAELERRNTQVSKQIERQREDPAYLERIGREEFGFEPPGAEVVWVESADEAEPPAATSPESNADPREELATELERATRTNPLISVFVLDATRPIVMAMSGGLMLVALTLLARGRWSGGAPEERP